MTTLADLKAIVLKYHDPAAVTNWRELLNTASFQYQEMSTFDFVLILHEGGGVTEYCDGFLSPMFSDIAAYEDYLKKTFAVA